MNTQWLQEASRLEQASIDFVMVSVLSIKGSTPREVGARMLVTQQGSYGTIGGGNLEFQAIDQARALLLTQENQLKTQDFPLGATLGQCCGGFVTLLFESLIQPKFHLAIFGAGHVGKAIVHCLEQMPCKVTWVDNRSHEFPSQVADNIDIKLSEYPVDEVIDMPDNSFYLVLTHNHQLDLELTEAILKRQDSAFLGVIGSKTKSARFKHRLKSKGFTADQIDQMHCPMGDTGIKSKQPGEIAIATLAQILKVKQSIADVKKTGLFDSQTTDSNTFNSDKHDTESKTQSPRLGEKNEPN